MKMQNLINSIEMRIFCLWSRIFPGKIYYINGPENLPRPLTKEEEKKAFEELEHGSREAKNMLIEHNLRLVVYIARKFESTGIGVEDLTSIGTIGLIKAVNTFEARKILMFIRKTQPQKNEVSIDEPLNVDWDGNELLLSDVLGTDSDCVNRGIEQDAERQVLNEAVAMLNEREHKIMVLRFGLSGEKEHTQKEVADIIGISQSYISRLEKKIISRLRRELEKTALF